ncbi:TPA: ABC transporter permease [Campylobacter coli]|uniref:ABC transporter permease n=1 Tax=Campylobacter coli TaxID=195 RepID=UPI000E6D463E|nr:ABC transporter permease [Campylobacter coli]RJF62527.1 ABC transporter permease [Campylobacter coli]HEF3475701.1 ABC transporter permease [Campylobacter coli]
MISKTFMPMFLISRLYFTLKKEEKLDIQIRKILKEKDELAEEKSLWISKVLPF